jgi:polysaccharide deacetylase 2 family uncharacterized protein YibQ
MSCVVPWRRARAGVPASIALIIDDIGYSRSRLRLFLGLDVPMTFSVLPRLPLSRDLAKEIAETGRELMLHQPMEPINPAKNPGPGALYVGDRPERIADILGTNLAEMPRATGVNNHMGSRFTASSPEIVQALDVVKRNELFFIDSMTSSRSIAFETARRMNLSSGRRSVFLDNRREAAAVTHQMHRLETLAIRWGHAVGIGHPFGQTAEGIRRYLQQRKSAVVRLVMVSDTLEPMAKPPQKTPARDFSG